MRLIHFTLLTLIAGCTAASPSPATPAAPPTPAPSPSDAAAIDQTLAQLDQVGKSLKEFAGKVKLTEEDTAMGGDVSHTGTVAFQKKPDGATRIHIVFDQRLANGVRAAEKTEYLLENQWLTDRNYRAKNETKYELFPPGQKIDLFKLGQGPFPLPIGQTPAEVRTSFDVTKPAPAKDDLPGAVHLLLIPKPTSDLAKKFHSIEVYVDQKSHMPTRVITVDVKQQRTSTTDLTDLTLNPPTGLKDPDFQLPNIENQGWQRSVQPLKS